MGGFCAQTTDRETRLILCAETHSPMRVRVLIVLFGDLQAIQREAGMRSGTLHFSKDSTRNLNTRLVSSETILSALLFGTFLCRNSALALTETSFIPALALLRGEGKTAAARSSHANTRNHRARTRIEN